MQNGKITHRPLHKRLARGVHLAFIPHPHNQHQPHALRLPALRVYSVLLLVAKLGITGFLFLVYPSSGTFSSLTAGRMVELINESRVTAGVSTLTQNGPLTAAAAAKANDLIAKGYFAHTNPDGKEFFRWVREAGYAYSLAGENLAKDFASAEAAHKALMASELHRKNILNEKFRDVGLAVVSGTLEGKETYVLVEMFGAPPAAKPTTQIAKAPPPAPPPQPTATPPPPTPTTPTTPTLPKTSEPTPPLTYRAALTDQSHANLALTAGQGVSIQLAFQNVGTAPWQEPVQLLASAPTSGDGFFDETWMTKEIVATAAEQTVLPGSVAHFLFTLRAGGTDGETTQSFSLTARDQAIADSAVSLTALITNPELTVANPEPRSAPSVIAAGAPILTAGAFTEAVSTRVLIANALARNPDLPFWFFLMFLVAAFLVNLLVRIRVQHAHLIAHVLLVIVLTGALIATNVHFLERVATNLVIR